MNTANSKTILFITGAFVHSSCWDEWRAFFEKLNYKTSAPPWPNKDAPAKELRQRHPDHVIASMRLTTLISHYENIVRSMSEKPIIIGHSIGGLIAQILNEKGLATAVVAIHSVPPQGIFTFKFSFLKAGWGPLGLFTNPNKSFLMDFKQWQYAFANCMSEIKQQKGYEQFAIPESKRIVRDTITSAARIDFSKPHNPLLFIAGSTDHTIPASLNYDNYKKYSFRDSVTDFAEFKFRNHFVLGQCGWEQIALYIHKWLEKKSQEHKTDFIEPIYKSLKLNTMKTIKLNFKNVAKLFYLMALSIFMLVSCSKKQENESQQQEIPTEEITEVKPADPPSNFKHETALVNGVNIHYVIGGQGEPLVLIHGFGQNWYMWNRLLPELSKHFTVIAPDLRGVGESDKPESGYDKKTMASDVHELVKKLGYDKINLAGHDIGLMVAYAYAAQYGPEVKKIALLDALLPGVEPVWSQVSASAWWFGFFSWPASGDIVKGKEKEFLTNFWPMVGHVKDPFTPEETAEFIRAYSVDGATTGTFKWFGAFPQDGKDNVELMKKKLKMPLLAMGGEYFAAAFLKEHSKLVAENVSESKIAGAGHWIVQENTAQVQKDLINFFTTK